MRIVVVADIHACRPWMPLKAVEAIADEAQSLGGDMIALLGDYVGHLPFARREAPDDVAAILARLTAPLGVWAVFGNHDWYDDVRGRGAEPAETRWHRAFAGQGIDVLENASTLIDAGGQPMWLAGLGSQHALKKRRRSRRDGVDDLGATLAGVGTDDPVILLAHEPDIFPDLPGHVDLTLSGHTHAGQIRFGSFAPIVPSRHGRRYAWGRYSEDGRALVVSGGLGCSGVPLRLGVPPEITVVDVSGPGTTR